MTVAVRNQFNVLKICRNIATRAQHLFPSNPYNLFLYLKSMNQAKAAVIHYLVFHFLFFSQFADFPLWREFLRSFRFKVKMSTRRFCVEVIYGQGMAIIFKIG